MTPEEKLKVFREMFDFRIKVIRLTDKTEASLYIKGNKTDQVFTDGFLLGIIEGMERHENCNCEKCSPKKDLV